MHIKYIICKLIDSPDKVCPWIERCNKHTYRSLWILYASLIMSLFSSNKRYTFCLRRRERRDISSEESINHEKEQYLCGECRKRLLFVDSFHQLAPCWGLSQVSRYPTRPWLSQAEGQSLPAIREPPAHSASYQVTRLSNTFTLQLDTDAERSYQSPKKHSAGCW